MSKRMKKIYVDMDGVLANFEKKWVELHGFDPEMTHKHKKERKEQFKQFVKNHEFAVLEPMPDMETLVNYLNDKLGNIPKEILSSTAHEDTYEPISQQKKVWLRKYKIDWKDNYVPGKKHKYKFAEPGYVLIDDDKQNIEDWNKAGGIGILHKDALTTIALLKLYS
jgi:5'(3')-deoxyribonucleotidase